MPRKKSVTKHEVQEEQPVEITKAVSADGETHVKDEIPEGKARVMYHGNLIESDALHALTVLSKRGGSIIDINLDEQAAITFCDNYEINYPSPATKSNLMEAITKRF